MHVLLSRVQLGDPVDHSPAGSSAHGIFQARILEWLPFSPPGHLANPGINLCLLHWQADPCHRTTSGGLVAKLCPTLATPWMAAWQSPLSVGSPFWYSWLRMNVHERIALLAPTN